MILRTIRALLVFLVLVGCAPRGPQYYPEVAAHRGDRQAGADNSRAALLSGIDREFPYLEIDIRYSKDKAMILSHDRNVRRSAFEGIAVADETPLKEVTLSELQAVPLRGGGGALLTVEEAFAMLAGSKSTYLLDLKERDPVMLARIVSEAEKSGVETRIIVQCQSPEIAEFVRKTHPLTRILARADTPDEVVRFLALRPEIVQVDSEWAEPDVINRIRASGAKVLIKAVDTSDDSSRGWRRLKRRGADIVLTDYPESLAELSETGLSPNRSISISNGL